jgi:hypothetical protein
MMHILLMAAATVLTSAWLVLIVTGLRHLI